MEGAADTEDIDLIRGLLLPKKDSESTPSIGLSSLFLVNTGKTEYIDCIFAC